MNQVTEVSGIRRIMEYIKLAFEPLLGNDGIIENDKVEGLDKIISQQNSKRINELEEQTSRVHIALENDKNIVQKATVSEKEAQRKADEVHKAKEGKTIIQEQIKE